MMQANQEASQGKFEEIIQKIDSGMVVLGEKVKTLEHRLEGLDEKTDYLDDGLQRIDKELAKQKTQGPIAISTSSGAKVDLPRFDGSSSWTAFKHQFEIIAKAHAWDNEKSFASLALALRGDALMVFENLPPERKTLETLIGALEARYGDKHLEHLYRAQLRDAKQKPGESLQQWAPEIKRLVRRA